MRKINVEIKAKCNNPDKIRSILKKQKAKFIGVDYQTDTYFKVNSGRLKLREGNIENNLIHYQRNNQKKAKKSDCILYKIKPGSELKKILTESLGILATIKKEREIYYVGNIKFHIDRVEKLGNFIEIEAASNGDDIPEIELKKQCEEYIKIFDIEESKLASYSYSDMMLEHGWLV